MKLNVKGIVNVEGTIRPAMDIAVAMEVATSRQNKAHEEDSVEDAEEKEKKILKEIKGFSKRNATSATNPDAGLASITWKNKRRHITNSVNTPNTPQNKKLPHSTSSISLLKSKE